MRFQEQLSYRTQLEPPIRVLIVYHHLPHYRLGVFSRLASSSTLDVTFCAGLNSRDGSIETITDFFPDRTVHLRNLWIGKFLWQRGLIRTLLTADYDAVIFLADGAFITTWIGAAIVRMRRRHVAFWTIGWHRIDATIRALVKKCFFALAHQLLLYGNIGAELGRLAGFPASKLVVIYNSVPLATSTPRPTHVSRSLFESALPPRNIPTIGAVLRLNAEKRLDILLNAAARLKQRRERLAVLLVGDGPERERLRAKAAELGVELYLPGPAYSFPLLAAAYSRIDITVVPSAIGLTAIQSLMFGTPVISGDDFSTQMPEVESILPDLNGALYRQNDADALALAIDEWLDRTLTDPVGVSDKCRISVSERWTAERQAANIEAALQAALTCRSGSGAR